MQREACTDLAIRPFAPHDDLPNVCRGLIVTPLLDTEPSLQPWLARLPVRRISLTFRAQRDFGLPPRPGSIVRGAFGAALREQACPQHARNAACVPGAPCAYGAVFESSPPAGMGPLSGQTQIPHPLSLFAACTAQDALQVDMVLMGAALSFETVLVSAMTAAVSKGLGKSRVAGQLLQASVDDMGWRPPPADGNVRLNWLSPLRLTRHGRTLGAAQVSAGHLLTGLVRRLGFLVQYHGQPGPTPDLPTLTALASKARFEQCHWRFQDDSRYSARQQRAIPLGGLLGTVQFDAGSTRAFWPVLQMGEWVQAGKGTIQGLGRYQLENS